LINQVRFSGEQRLGLD